MTNVLTELMQLHRPHGGDNEYQAQLIIEQAIRQADTEVAIESYYDRHGNLIYEVGASRKVLFTAHVDTVHRADGKSVLSRIESFVIASDAATGKDCVLGADDAAGCYLLTELIAAGVEGTYIFFVGEEVGGIGSGAFVLDNPDFKADIAIAFDRRGYSDVITHQASGRCCSDKFALALAKQLDMKYKPCSSGVYTDTAEFVDLVPECTNVSVGYFDEHTSSERLDIEHLMQLRAALLKVDWESLPIERDPKAVQDYRTWDYKVDQFNTSWLDDLQSEQLAEEAEALYLKYTESDLPEDIMQFLSDCAGQFK